MHKKPFTLITGASEGLGRCFALECARRQRHLVLVSLPGSGLPGLAAFIREQFGVQVLYIQTDLSEEANCLEVHRQLQEWGIALNMLINNVGMGGTFFFDQRDVDYYCRQIRLNTIAPTLLTRLFLNNLVANAPAYILNVSSMAALCPLPQKQVYSGTKSYLLAFSESLRRELKGKKVYVSAICPGATNTSWRLMLSHVTGTWLSRQSVLEPQAVARIGIEGLLRKKAVIIPGVWNKMFMALNRICPAWFQEMLTDMQLKHYKPNGIVRDIVPKNTGKVQELAVP